MGRRVSASNQRRGGLRWRWWIGRAGAVYGALLIVLTMLSIAGLALSAFDVWRQARANAVIAGLNAGRDIEVGTDASPPLLFARGQFLVKREEFDAAYPLLDALSRRAPNSRERGALLYDLANARLRAAYELARRNRVTDAVPLVNLAKDELRAALRIAPSDWNYKHNLDVAMQLVRDFPASAQTETEEKPESPEELWTDLPSRPGGLP